MKHLFAFVAAGMLIALSVIALRQWHDPSSKPLVHVNAVPFDSTGPLLPHTTTIDMRRQSDIKLSGQQAAYVVLPADTKLETAISAFQAGKWSYIGDEGELGAAPDEHRRTSLFVLLNYTNDSTQPLVLSYEMTSPAFVGIWTNAPDRGDQLAFAGASGSDVDNGTKRSMLPSWVPVSIVPRLVLNPTAGRVVTVIARVDTVRPFYRRFFMNTGAGLLEYLGTNNLLAGGFGGATLIGVVLAAIGAKRRRSADYLLFVLAISMIAYWYLIRYEVFVGPDSVAWRRFSVSGPLLVYFLVNAIATKRLLAPPSINRSGADSSQRATLPLIQSGLIHCSLLVTGACMALIMLYAFTTGTWAPGATWLEWLEVYVPSVSTLLLLAATIDAWRRRTPGMMPLVAAHSIAAAGCSVFMIRALVESLGHTWQMALTFLSSYALPAEACLWALALGARYHYLEILAQGRVEAERADEARRVRSEISLSNSARERALSELDGSYHVLKNTYQTLLHLVDTYTHSMGTQLAKLGSMINTLTSDQAGDRERSEARIVLSDAMESVEGVKIAAAQALQARYPVARVMDKVKAQIDVITPKLAAKQIAIDLAIAPEVETALADGFPLFQTLHELLTNVDRYAEPDSTVTIDLKVNLGRLHIAVQNAAILRGDDASLRLGTPIKPASSTYNGDVSTGHGLAALGMFLGDYGGRLIYAPKPPDCFCIEAILPIRSA
jgi:hypothetical protein